MMPYTSQNILLRQSIGNSKLYFCGHTRHSPPYDHKSHLPAELGMKSRSQLPNYLLKYEEAMNSKTAQYGFQFPITTNFNTINRWTTPTETTSAKSDLTTKSCSFSRRKHRATAATQVHDPWCGLPLRRQTDKRENRSNDDAALLLHQVSATTLMARRQLQPSHAPCQWAGHW